MKHKPVHFVVSWNKNTRPTDVALKRYCQGGWVAVRNDCPQDFGSGETQTEALDELFGQGNWKIIGEVVE